MAQGMRSEASRETAVVSLNRASLIEIFMNVNKWSTIFSSIVARAEIQEILSTGSAGNYDGAFQVMKAEFQVPSPLVPTREYIFVRHCKKNQDGQWSVVDVSIDSVRPIPNVQCRRRPSGCLIQELPNGCSEVTWVEHVEAHDRGVHSLYKPLINSYLAFGAKRWINTLKRQCERLTASTSINIPNDGFGIITTSENKKRLLRLADQMVGKFFENLTASAADQWTTLSGIWADDVCVKIHRSNGEAYNPYGTVLSASTSFWLPVPPEIVFGYLRDGTTRSEWDMLFRGAVLDMACIPTGGDHGNCISLICDSTNANRSHLILQESSTEPTGSYMIFTSIDASALNSVLSADHDIIPVPLVPSGFSILPDGLQSQSQTFNPINEATTSHEGHARREEGGTNGSLLTVAFQIPMPTVQGNPLPPISTAAINAFIAKIVDKIKAAVSGGNGAQ